MRIAEALSKMRLQPFATEADVEEALRLFQVSTLDAALSGTLSGEPAGLRAQDSEGWVARGGRRVVASLHLLPCCFSPGHFLPDGKSRFPPDP